MHKITIYYYIVANGKNPVREFIESLDYKQRAKIRRVFLTVKEYGIPALGPHAKKLVGAPLWELRILGKDNIRILYTLFQGKIVILHGFIKKSIKTPKKELEVALRRYHSLISS